MNKTATLLALGQRAIDYYKDTGFCVFCDADDCAGRPHEDHCDVGKVSGIDATPERAAEKASQRAIVQCMAVPTAARGAVVTPRERAEALFTAERLGETWWRIYDARGWHVATAPGEAEAMMLVADLAAPIAAAIESALAEQAAGEAERVREAVALARDGAAQIADRYGHAHIADAIRALRGAS